MTVTISKYRPVRNWAPFVGRWSLEGHSLTYAGPQDEQMPSGICVSDVRARDGAAKANIALSRKTSGRVLLGYRSPQDWNITAGLGGYDLAYVMSTFNPGRGWTGVSVAGTEENLVPQKPYAVEVWPTGQRLAMSVDEVRVLEHTLREPLSNGHVGLFAWGNDPVKFSQVEAASNTGLVFVVMQFSNSNQELYADVIQPVVREFRLEAYHVGDIYGPGSILNDIVQGLIDASIVTAEITEPNQNVSYELGYAHALNKPTILLAERGRQLPFDITGYRCLFYENLIGGEDKVEESPRKHLQAITHDWSVWV